MEQSRCFIGKLLYLSLSLWTFVQWGHWNLSCPASLWQCMAPEVTFCEHRESKTRYMEVALIYKLVELKMMFIFHLYWTKKRLACNSNKKAKVNSAEKNLSKKDEGAPSNDRRKRWITEERSVLLSAEKWWHLLHFCEYLKFYQVKEKIFFF